MTELLNQELPKWPMLFITGKPVSKEQAMHIIFKTDRFITSLGASTGNDYEWTEKAKIAMGVSDLDTNDYWDIQHAWYKQCISTEYLKNDWLSSCFIYGPNGWCSPQGEIYYDYNVGKWPNLSAIHGDLETIAAAFPFLEMAVTVFDREHSEEDPQPVLSFKVHRGEVEIIDEPDWSSLHHATRKPRDDYTALCNLFAPPSIREHGMEWSECVEMFEEIRVFVETWKRDRS